MADQEIRTLERAGAASPDDWPTKLRLVRARERAGIEPGYEACSLPIPWDPTERSDDHEIVFAKSDVAVVVSEWSDDGGSYGEWDGAGVYVLKDGRFACVEGSCDTTGWGCQDSVSSAVGRDLDTLIRANLSQSARRSLGLALEID